MPLDCIHKPTINDTETSCGNCPECGSEMISVTMVADGADHNRKVLVDNDYVLADSSTWIAVMGNHENRGISIHIKRTDQGVCVGLYPLNAEEGNAIGVCRADFPEPPEARYLVTDYAARLGWDQASQVNVMADFINANNLEEKLQTYLDNRADEEEEEIDD